MKQFAITIYLILGIGLMAKVGMTVYQLSSVMHHNAMVAQLQTEKQSLAHAKQQVQAQLAERNSLHLVLATAEAYTEEMKPIVVESAPQLASQL